jgi:hypothetical protein
MLLSSLATSPAVAAPTQGMTQAGEHKTIDPKDFQAGRYIVVLTDKPAATYDGGTAGYAATKPRAGRKLDARRAEV